MFHRPCLLFIVFFLVCRCPINGESQRKESSAQSTFGGDFKSKRETTIGEKLFPLNQQLANENIHFVTKREYDTNATKIKNLSEISKVTNNAEKYEISQTRSMVKRQSLSLDYLLNATRDAVLKNINEQFRNITRGYDRAEEIPPEVIENIPLRKIIADEEKNAVYKLKQATSARLVAATRENEARRHNQAADFQDVEKPVQAELKSDVPNVFIGGAKPISLHPRRRLPSVPSQIKPAYNFGNADDLSQDIFDDNFEQKVTYKTQIQVPTYATVENRETGASSRSQSFFPPWPAPKFYPYRSLSKANSIKQDIKKPGFVNPFSNAPAQIIGSKPNRLLPILSNQRQNIQAPESDRLLPAIQTNDKQGGQSPNSQWFNQAYPGTMSYYPSNTNAYYQSPYGHLFQADTSKQSAQLNQQQTDNRLTQPQPPPVNRPIKPSKNPIIDVINRYRNQKRLQQQMSTTTTTTTTQRPIANKSSEFVTLNSAVEASSSPSKIRILCIGDSLTSGYYGNRKIYHPYAVMLGYLLNTNIGNEFEIVNRGVGGEKVHTQMYKRLQKILIAEAPLDLVIILGGLNDLIKLDLTVDIFADITALHELCHRYGVSTVSLTIPETRMPLSRRVYSSYNEFLVVWGSLNERIRNFKSNWTISCDLARQFPLASLSDPEKRAWWSDDYIHPTIAGYDQIGRIIYDCIVAIL